MFCKKKLDPTVNSHPYLPMYQYKEGFSGYKYYYKNYNGLKMSIHSGTYLIFILKANFYFGKRTLQYLVFAINHGRFAFSREKLYVTLLALS